MRRRLGIAVWKYWGGEDLVGEVAGVGVFEELAVWGAFAFGLDAVAVVD